jgi:uncharacterized repeat protein (TIGR01451 family)
MKPLLNLPARKIRRGCHVPTWELCLRILCCIFILSSLLTFSGPAPAAQLCASPGLDGTSAPSGVINTYYPGISSVPAGASSIPVGSSSGNSKVINTGDLLLVIQMQDADINYSNNSNYGAGGTAGSGYTSLNQTGVYEYVTAIGPVSGGLVPISGVLANSYRARPASGFNGQSTYQVIRVPQYSTATVSGTVNALPWNGSVGGVVAMDVAGVLTVNGTISANGAGFRGGLGRTLTGGGGANTDYRTSYTNNANGSKGEGIAGTPQYMNSPSVFNGSPAQAGTLGSGYPGGKKSTDYSYGRGAPGNAGGGGTDGNPTANDQNSGGGGGGNYSAGAKGGNSWNSNLPVGGEGGSGVAGLAFNQVVMGGGGGAGTTNNGTSDNNTYTDPPGLACNDYGSTGICSSGAPGGGIILIRANSIGGSGLITANGGSGYNVGNDSAGGGGAGGSVVLDTQTGGSVTVSADGGDGGNAWRSQSAGSPFPGNHHGPGGGGSGGFIAYSPATGFAVLATVDPGISGKSTTDNSAYGSMASSGGIYTFQSPNTAGPEPGAICAPPTLTVLKSASPSPGVNPGQVVTYTVIATNTVQGLANSVILSDSLSPYLYWGVNTYGAGVAFQFTDGAPASGLTLGAPVYSRDNGATWTYAPVSGGGGAPAGYDANVTNWRIPMNGTMNANGANFTITYKTMVK